MKTVIETYKKFSPYCLDGLTQKEPSCFNSEVCNTKFRITIEEIKEPDDIVVKRLKKLWEDNDNHHNWGALQAEGKKYGLEFK